MYEKKINESAAAFNQIVKIQDVQL